MIRLARFTVEIADLNGLNGETSSVRLLVGEAGVRHRSGGAPEEEQPRYRPAHRGLRHDAPGDRHERGGRDGRREGEFPRNPFFFFDERDRGDSENVIGGLFGTVFRHVTQFQ